MRKTQLFTYCLIGVLVILVGVIGWNQYSQQQAVKTQQTSEQFLPNIPVDQITAITLDQGTKTTALVKQDKTWIVTSEQNAPANNDAISSLLSTLNHATIQTVIARNASQAATYGLDATKKLTITIKAGDQTITTIDVGQYGAVPQTYYAQRPNDPAIYLIGGDVSTLHQADWKQATNTNQAPGTNVNVPVTTIPGK